MSPVVHRSRSLQAHGVASWAVILGLALLMGVPVPGCSRPDPRPSVRAELRSWVVAGRGRHLFLTIFMPGVSPRGSGGTASGAVPVRVEFGSTAQRSDYVAPADLSKAGRVARINPGVRIRPVLSEPDNRFEAEYWLTSAQARVLTRDRLFTAPYALVGRNSNSAMARAMKDAGLALPARVANGGGLLGEFPGIDLDPGADIPRSRWDEFGLRPSQEPAPGAGVDGRKTAR